MPRTPTRAGDTFSSRRSFNLRSTAEPLETRYPGREGCFGLGEIGSLLFHLSQMSPKVGKGGGGLPERPTVVASDRIGGRELAIGQKQGELDTRSLDKGDATEGGIPELHAGKLLPQAGFKQETGGGGAGAAARFGKTEEPAFGLRGNPDAEGGRHGIIVVNYDKMSIYKGRWEMGIIRR